jgi:subtilisin-like proprotein convertase family protein/C1A family cysteine protease
MRHEICSISLVLPLSRWQRTLLLCLIATQLVGCAAKTISRDEVLDSDSINDESHVLLPLDGIEQDVPSDDSLPSEVGKEDAVLPTRFDMLATQSPVRDQGDRGTCVAFAVSALAEHFHRKLNLLASPDFSEQYLYWLTHDRADDSWAVASSQLRSEMNAMNEYGVPLEPYWPYETQPWTVANDPECVKVFGRFMPAYCLTNGQAPQASTAALKYFLGESRNIRRSTIEIKSYIAAHEDPVAIVVKVAHPIWDAPTNYRYGYVPLSSSTDGLDIGGGHAVLIVGWDDTVEIQRVDVHGTPEVDSRGFPIVDRGAFLFRNSWGTSGWGRQNPYRAGYGLMSYRYFEEMGATARVADAPQSWGPEREICGNGIDDNANGQVDCDDSGCASFPSCVPAGVSSATFTGNLTIPDNDAQGLIAPLSIGDTGTLAYVSLYVGLTHSYVGDVQIELVHPSGIRTLLRDHVGRNASSIAQAFPTTAFNGLDAHGDWQVIVRDDSLYNTGRVTNLNLVVGRCVATSCAAAHHGVHTYTSNGSVAIPDDDTRGASLDISIPPGGVILPGSSLVYRVQHPYPGDLRIVLEKVGGPSVQVVAFGAATSAAGSFVLPQQFLEMSPMGTWRLSVYDLAAQDEGNIVGLALILNRQ